MTHITILTGLFNCGLSTEKRRFGPAWCIFSQETRSERWPCCGAPACSVTQRRKSTLLLNWTACAMTPSSATSCLPVVHQLLSALNLSLTGEPNETPTEHSCSLSLDNGLSCASRAKEFTRRPKGCPSTCCNAYSCSGYLRQANLSPMRASLRAGSEVG